MNPLIFQEDKAYIKQSLENGEVDYMEVASEEAETEFFDPEGIFVGDASYVFVPDNENYEGSVVMLSDEHNHPVNKEELTPEQLKRCSYKRCYKWVSLIHTNRNSDFFFFSIIAKKGVCMTGTN